MSKVITFSRQYPSYHPRKGEPTYFVEKFWNSIYDRKDREEALLSHEVSDIWSLWCEIRDSILPKHHTIRSGHRFEVGNFFSPRVWGNDINPKSGRSGPYHSKQIIIAPDIEIKKVWDFKKDIEGVFYVNGKQVDVTSSIWQGKTIAENDGLSSDDFLNWFPVNGKEFSGQIICWNDSIEYSVKENKPSEEVVAL